MNEKNLEQLRIWKMQNIINKLDTLNFIADDVVHHKTDGFYTLAKEILDAEKEKKDRENEN